MLIVIDSPHLDLLAGIGQREEPSSVEAFLPQTTAESLKKHAVCGLTGPGEVEFDLAPVGSLVQRPAGELGPIVAMGCSWVPAAGQQDGPAPRPRVLP